MNRYLTRLRLTAFRNYSSASVEADGRHIVLVGPNGAGKTNLLEAVSLLSPGRGLRRAPFEEIAEVGSEGSWAVAATLETDAGPVDLGTGWTPGQPGRRVRINGANAKTVDELSDWLRLLWLTPSMDGLFTGPPGDRRRFLDRLVMTLIPGHSSSVSDFETAMRQRNRLLEDNGDPRWLSAIEAEMASHAAAMHFARADTVLHLNALIEKGRGDDGFPMAHLALTPLREGMAEPISSAALESELLALWSASRAPDRAAGRTIAGPHRVDLAVSYAQKAMPAFLGSTGEQKALLIGLVLAHARLVRSMTRMTPLLLLDEVAAHLDPDRRGALYAALDALDTQVLMTGTDTLLFDALGDRAQRFRVSDGSVATLS